MAEGRKYSGHYDAVLDIIRNAIRGGHGMIPWDYGTRKIPYADSSPQRPFSALASCADDGSGA